MSLPQSLVIIGGGTAGLAAAVEAARCGLRLVLLDEKPSAQSSGPPQPVFDRHQMGPSSNGTDSRKRLLGELREVADRVQVVAGAAVLAVLGVREILWARDGTSSLWRADQLILATGGTRRVIPFPGWTLPGVSEPDDLPEPGSLPERRAIVAGTGPRLFDVGRQLLERGFEVMAILEAGKPPWMTPEAIPNFPEGSDPLESARRSWEVLNRANVPIHFQHAILKADGPGRVTSATFGAVASDDWRPLTERNETVGVDLIVTDFGDVSSHELAVLAGCRQRYDRSVSGWVPLRDPLMQSTVPGIFTIGDGAGVAGGLVAEEEGRIAGITAAERAGTISAGEASARREEWQARLSARSRLRATLDETSRIRAGLFHLMEPDTVFCPCEGVTLASIRFALGEGSCDMSSLKLLTRLGMGKCQGSRCGPAAELFLGCETRRLPEELGRINPRPPVRPVTLGALSRMDGAPSTVLEPRHSHVTEAS